MINVGNIVLTNKNQVLPNKTKFCRIKTKLYQTKTKLHKNKGLGFNKGLGLVLLDILIKNPLVYYYFLFITLIEFN